MAKKTLDMITKEKNFLSAVVYVHNDEKEIGHFLDMLIECFETNFEHSEIICVNDHSDDESVRVIKEAKKLDHAVIIHVLTKKGKGYEPAEKQELRESFLWRH